MARRLEDPDDAERQAFYNSTTWRKAARLHLLENPICMVCESRGIFTLATLVDHSKPIRDGGARLDPENFVSMCRRCHAAKTARETHSRARARAS